jgi:hypothetical protein
MHPLGIHSDGHFQLLHGPVRVGRAVQPYHAVPLSQVKRLLSAITVSSGGVFRVQDFFELYDSATGFCLSEPGIQESLDYIYTGKIVDTNMILSATTILPTLSSSSHVRERLVIIDVFSPFTLSEPNWTDGNLDYVYTGKVVGDMRLADIPITPTIPSVIKASESIVVLGTSYSHILGETGWTDGNLDYVYTGIGVGIITVTDACITIAKQTATDTVLITDVGDRSDLVFLTHTYSTVEFPDKGFVWQKTKPTPTGERRRLGDRAIIKPKIKVTDKSRVKDAANGYCIFSSFHFVPEPLSRMQFAVVTDKVCVNTEKATGALEVV